MSRMGLFVVIGGLVGLFAGGVSGLFAGAAVGYGIGVLMLRVLLPHGRGVIEKQFLVSTFAVMGALCKADGRVSRDEIRVAEHFFGQLGLSPEQRKVARAAFNRGKAPGFDLAAEIERLRSVVRSNPALLQLFLQIQFSAIAADGLLHDAERRLLRRVARLLGLAEADVNRLEAMLSGAAGAAPGQDAGGHAGSSLDDAYATLGVKPSASDAEVKKAYRRLMSRYHPDKLASQGLPDGMREMAKERVRQVRGAYDRIKQARQGREAA